MLRLGLVLAVGLSFFVHSARALDLDWSGQFRSDLDWVLNYTMDPANVTNDTSRAGYYIPGGGDTSAFFQSLFLKLKPTITVNDNLSIKSEWWVGDPIFGFWGAASPYPSEQRYYYSTHSRGSTITAQRLWGELQTDMGTLQIGRAPLHWGLGLVWHSGEGFRDRYPSTGDMIRFSAKFGSFVFSPSVIRYSMGNNIGGACQTPGAVVFPAVCTTQTGGAGVTEASLAVKYENKDEDFELGLNILRRIGGAAQDANYGYLGIQGTSAGFLYNTFDIYGAKRLGPFTVAGEVPIVSGGTIGGVPYNTVAFAGEAGWKVNDVIEAKLKLGRAPGQANAPATGPTGFNGFFYHPNYKVGLVMFNYQFRNFAGPNSLNDAATGPNNLRSPFDNPLFNAWYVSAAGSYLMGRWKFNTNWALATATDPAAASGQFFNQWTRKFEAYSAGAAQQAFIGWEMDYGVNYKWDDAFNLGVDVGVFFPGAFYKFSNTAVENTTSPILATSFNATVNF